LAPLIGKPLAIISDARFVGKTATSSLNGYFRSVEKTPWTVNRKYRDQWTGKLPSRLHVISNELPRLGDASTAVVGRIICSCCRARGSARKITSLSNGFV